MIYLVYMKKTLTSKDVSWHLLSAPSAEELAEFARETQLLPTDAEFIAQERQRPEVAERPKYILALIQVPVFQKVERITRGVSVYVVVREGAVWTLHFEDLPPLEELYVELEKNQEQQEEYFGGSALGIAAYLLRRLMDDAFEKLERLAKHIDIAGDAVFHGNERKMVEEVALLTRDVTDFRRVIRPQRKLFDVPITHALSSDDVRYQWWRLHQHISKQWDILEGLDESVRQLGKTNYALLQHKENQLLRLLALYSTLGIPALLLVNPLFSPGESFTGMLIFWVVFLGLLGALLTILWRFHGKRIL